MFSILSLIFRYIFILVIYFFMFGIIRLIYLDIKAMGRKEVGDSPYLKLINRKDTLPFNIQEAYSLGSEETIGRGRGNSIIIRDAYISKSHVKIAEDEQHFFLEDLGSANGTYVNDHIVEDVVKLENGDRLSLGQIEFLFVSGE